MIFLPENDMQKKRSGRNDDREILAGVPARGCCGGPGAEVSTTSLNLFSRWLSRGCASIRGGVFAAGAGHRCRMRAPALE
jgi:hypothetical protein